MLQLFKCCLLMVATAAVVSASGCGRGVSLVPVSGRVEVDGKPLTTGRIMVVPDKGRPATGVVGNDGRFTLSTFAPNDGVMPGKHRVEVVATDQVSATRRRWLVPARVRRAATSDVFLDVSKPSSDAVISVSTGGEKLETEDTNGD